MASLKPFKPKRRKRTLDSWTTHHLKKTTQDTTSLHTIPGHIIKVFIHSFWHTFIYLSWTIQIHPQHKSLNASSLYFNTEIYRILSSRYVPWRNRRYLLYSMLFSVEYHRHVTIIVCLWKSNGRLHKSHLDIEGLQASTSQKGDREMHIGTWIYEACMVFFRCFR